MSESDGREKIMIITVYQELVIVLTDVVGFSMYDLLLRINYR